MFFNHRRSVIDCTVRNLSTHGASLQVESRVGIPDTFDLLIDGETLPHRCRVAWQTGNRMGVAFIGLHAQPEPVVIDDPPADVTQPSGLLRPLQDRNQPEASRGEMSQMHTALDEIGIGIVLLDTNLKVQFINRAFRAIWHLPGAKSKSKPTFTALMRDAQQARSFAIPKEGFDTFIADRLLQINQTTPVPIDLKLTDGGVFHLHCTIMSTGWRMITCSDATDVAKRAEEMEQLATVDSMTGITNRRHFLHQAEAEWRRYQRYHRPLSLMIIDIDKFKTINEKHGHAAGDQVLLNVAGICRDDLRTSDIVGRIGGEEFAMLLPETNIERAGVVAERLRRHIAASSCKVGNVEIPVTVSVGVAAASASMSGFDALMKLADQALYSAKIKGRNRIAWAGSGPAPAEYYVAAE